MKLEIEIAEVKFRIECEYVPPSYETGDSERMDIKNISLVSHRNVDMTEFFRYIQDNELDWEDLERMALHAFYELE